MTYKSSGTALPNRPTQRTTDASIVLQPPVYTRGVGSVKLATQAEVEQFLTGVWGEPALVVPSHIGGHGPAYYARSEGHWMPAAYDASGWHLDLALAECDYRKENPR